jgi:hypothetical protein
MMPLQGIDFYVSLSPERALVLAQGIALRFKYEGSNKSPEGAQAIDQILSLTAMGFASVDYIHSGSSLIPLK